MDTRSTKRRKTLETNDIKSDDGKGLDELVENMDFDDYFKIICDDGVCSMNVKELITSSDLVKVMYDNDKTLNEIKILFPCKVFEYFTEVIIIFQKNPDVKFHDEFKNTRASRYVDLLNLMAYLNTPKKYVQKIQNYCYFREFNDGFTLNDLNNFQIGSLSDSNFCEMMFVNYIKSTFPQIDINTNDTEVDECLLYDKCTYDKIELIQYIPDNSIAEHIDNISTFTMKMLLKYLHIAHEDYIDSIINEVND